MFKTGDEVKINFVDLDDMMKGITPGDEAIVVESDEDSDNLTFVDIPQKKIFYYCVDVKQLKR